MELARRRRTDLSGDLRIVDRFHRIHMAAGACAHAQSGDLCLCESGGCGLSGLADLARARGPVHWARRSHYCGRGGARDQLEAEVEICAHTRAPAGVRSRSVEELLATGGRLLEA